MKQNRILDIIVTVGGVGLDLMFYVTWPAFIILQFFFQLFNKTVKKKKYLNNFEIK